MLQALGAESARVISAAWSKWFVLASKKPRSSADDLNVRPGPGQKSSWGHMFMAVVQSVPPTGAGQYIRLLRAGKFRISGMNPPVHDYGCVKNLTRFHI